MKLRKQEVNTFGESEDSLTVSVPFHSFILAPLQKKKYFSRTFPLVSLTLHFNGRNSPVVILPTLFSIRMYVKD